MTSSVSINGQIPTDPATALVALAACAVLVKTLTHEEASSLVSLLPVALSVLPIVRR